MFDSRKIIHFFTSVVLLQQGHTQAFPISFEVVPGFLDTLMPLG